MESADVDLVIFDLDGTLVDSQLDIITAFNEGLKAVGAEPIPMEEVNRISSLIGMPLKKMYGVALSRRDSKQIDAACAAYRAYYFDHCADHTLPFPGVLKCLDRLASIPLAIATTKMTFMAVKLIELLGLRSRFALVQGTDGIPPKPDPSVLFLVTKKLGARPERGWMVGDTVHDINAGSRAGMKRCAVTYGVSKRSELERLAPDLIVDDLMDFGRYLIK